MNDFAAIYDALTGKIHSTFRGPEGSAADQLVPDGHEMLITETEVDLSVSPYVDLSGPDPVVTARPEMGATIDGLTISDIPEGAVLTIEGVEYTITGGEAELNFSAAGTYTVTLSHWPHYDQSFEVVAP